MVKWLLGVTIEPLPDTGLLAFRTSKSEKKKGPGLKTAPVRIGDEDDLLPARHLVS